MKPIKDLGYFKCVILSPKSLIYEKEVYSVFLKGDKGEFELLAYHFPLLSVLEEGEIIINWNESIAIKGGIVRFFANECVIMIEDVGAKVKQIEFV